MDEKKPSPAAATTTTSRSTTTTSSNNTRPGDTSSMTNTSPESARDDAAARLDERIAEQSRTFTATGTTDAEREAKQRARRANAMHRRQSSKVLHKMKSQASIGRSSRNLTKRQSSLGDSQVVALSNSKSSPSTLKPYQAGPSQSGGYKARSSFNNSSPIRQKSLEGGAIELVTSSESSNTIPSRGPKKFAKKEAPRTREPSVASSKSLSFSSRPGITNTRELDAKIAYKTGIPLDNDETESYPASLKPASRPGITSSRELDARIAYKTGIPLDADKNVQNEQARRRGNEPTGSGIIDQRDQSRGSSHVYDGSHSRSSNSRSGITNSRDLDELIAYKTGIPLDLEDEETQALPGCRHVAKVPAIPTEKQYTQKEYNSGAHPEENFLKNGKEDIEARMEADDMAVAVEIKEETEDSYIPSAVEYDPEAKPPIYKNRRFQLYGALASLILIVIILSALGTMVFKKDHQNEINETDDVPPPQDTSQSILSQLELVVGKEKLRNSDSAHYQAMKWITEEDPLQVGPTDLNLIQRFLLAVFYFETHKHGEWLSCNAPNAMQTEDNCLYQQLVDVFPSTYRVIPTYKWLSGQTECEWAGVKCDPWNNVIDINLRGQQLGGTLPVELAELSLLHQLSLGFNDFSGTIPGELAKMSQLLNLELHFNHLTGTIPAVNRASKLQVLNVADNHLTGSIPESIGDLVSLKGLYLYENQFTGSLPDTFSELILLNYIQLYHNFLTGTIPSFFGEMSPVELWLSNNEISGTIPSELGMMKRLKSLRLNKMNLSGTIPEELFNLTNLVILDLSKLNLSGSLSAEIAKLEDLSVFLVNDNELTGEIPTSMGGMELEVMLMYGNDFIGEVPQSVCYRKGPTGLKQLAVDCFPSVSDGTVRVSCDCCDVCCDHDTGVCHVE